MFLKINKHLILTNPENVVSLDNKAWESQISKRAQHCDYTTSAKKRIRKPLLTMRMSLFEDDPLFLRRCRWYKIPKIAA